MGLFCGITAIGVYFSNVFLVRLYSASYLSYLFYWTHISHKKVWGKFGLGNRLARCDPLYQRKFMRKEVRLVDFFSLITRITGP